MNQRELKRAIAKGKLGNLYIFCSEDYYLKKLYIERIRKAASLPLIRLDIDTEEDLDSLKAKMSLKGLFEKASLIHARLFFKLKSFNLTNRSPNIVIIDPISCDKIDHPAAVRFDAPSAEEIRDFILYMLKKENKTIQQETLRKLVNHFRGKTASQISQFVERLILFTGDERNIKAEDVAVLLLENPSHNAFELARYIIKRDKNGFLRVVDQVAETTEPHMLIGAVASSIIKNIQQYMKEENQGSEASQKRLTSLLKALYEMDVILKSASFSSFSELFKARMLIWFNEG